MNATCPLIFVHIGDKYYPNHVFYAIQQAYKWNPTAEIYFIADKCHAEKVENYPCIFVPLQDLPISKKHSDFMKRHNFDEKFRDGFWRFTTERLFILEEFMEYKGIKEAIHIENDNMIYFSLDYMLPILREEYVGIAAPFLGKDEITFGMLYVKDTNVLADLTVFLVSQAHTIQNEMQLGYQFIVENRDVADFLPVISNECDIRESDFEYATAHGSAFRGVFDAAAYGQYLGGTDERNGDGLQLGYLNKTSAFRADQFEYKQVKFDDSLMFWTAHRHGNSWPIYILHIHSKYLELFAS